MVLAGLAERADHCRQLPVATCAHFVRLAAQPTSVVGPDHGVGQSFNATAASPRSQAAQAPAWEDGQRTLSWVAPRVSSTWMSATGGAACSGAVAVAVAATGAEAISTGMNCSEGAEISSTPAAMRVTARARRRK